MKVTVARRSPIESVTLVLTENEAKDLKALLGCVGGKHQGTIRETTTPLWYALGKVIPEDCSERLILDSHLIWVVGGTR